MNRYIITYRRVIEEEMYLVVDAGSDEQAETLATSELKELGDNGWHLKVVVDEPRVVEVLEMGKTLR